MICSGRRCVLCYSYRITNAFNSDLAVGGRDSGASVHKCLHPWKARIDTTQRAKAGIESFRLSRSARDLPRGHIRFVESRQVGNIAILRLTMSIAVGELTRRDHITVATRGQAIRVRDGGTGIIQYAAIMVAPRE